MAAVGAPAAEDAGIKLEPKSTLTPPASEEADKNDDSGSELSDLDLDPDDNAEIVPDHYYGGGKIPVFKPTMKQFQSFKAFVDKIDKYGMKSGIVKVIPPKEWRNTLPALDEAVKTIKVKNPISQEFHGSHGTYTQANMEKQRSYNLPQWKSVSEESNHQPPAKRGERRRNQEKVTRSAAPRASKKAPVTPSDGKKRGPGRPRVRPLPTSTHKDLASVNDELSSEKLQVPPTPTSPATKPAKVKKESTSDGEEGTPSKVKGRQPKSVSSRRKHNSRDQAEYVDEEAFKDFDYRVHNQADWTSERCQELETAYWKSLTFNNPMYGADMPGSLFDDSTTSWNVAKLENLLDVLGQKVPGVNTAYLYLGMWKATFAWHLEDVDLYSINYIHFGAPKQWYSISQADARRFEAAMRSVWPSDAKNCDQFLRHKTYLISPQILKSQFNIEVNRLVHNEGEFVITYPYGYHSGYNLGYNCAESVNFATEAWLDYGKVARKCNCEADSVWVDVWDIERKLRGEPTPEYYEETEDEEEEDNDEAVDLPTPPGSEKGKAKARPQKRKRDVNDKGARPKIKKIRIKMKPPAAKEPCILCPNDPHFEDLLPTDNGKKAHRICAVYTPETDISKEYGSELVAGVGLIDKARLELKCNYCRSKAGSVFQCSQRKCTRAYHATCAASAGVQVEKGIVPVFIEDGTEYMREGIDFRCRFHRDRRPKYSDREACIHALEENALVRRAANKIQKGDIVQYQYYNSDVFAGVVRENRLSERALLVENLNSRVTMEVDHKWILVFDPSNSHLPKPSEHAKPLPAHLAKKSQITTEHPANEIPKADEPFLDPQSSQKWAEFNIARIPRNLHQVKIDCEKPKSWWFYLGKTSTEARAQYTSDLSVKVNDPAAHFLDSTRPVIPLPSPNKRQSYPASYPNASNLHAVNASRVVPTVKKAPQHVQHQPVNPKSQTKHYNGKYAINSESVNNKVPNLPKPLPNPPAFRPPAHKHQPTHPTSKVLQHSFQAPSANMGSRSSALPSMADIHRRSSNPGQSLEEYKQQYNQQTFARPTPNQAPVANMMSSSSSTTQSPYSRTSASLQTPPSSAHSNTNPRPRPRSDSVKALARFPYLQEAAQMRPTVYQSPYAPGGGFTETWQPIVEAKKVLRPRSTSLAGDYLMKQSPSCREAVKGHVRTISTEKAMMQLLESERRHREHLQRQRNNMPPPLMSPSLMQNQTFHPDHYPPRPFSDPSGFHDFGASYTQSHPYSPILGQEALQYPNAFSRPTAGLQFSSPHDFQLQMQREAEAQASRPPLITHDRNSYHAFVRDLQHGVDSPAHGHGGHNMDFRGGGGDGTSGSPLRRGMTAAGTEMLPMMQDHHPSF